MSTKHPSTRYKFIGDKNAPFTPTDDLVSAIAAQQNVLYSTPANPAGTTSTTGVMMGLGITFTPNKTGRVKVYMSFNMTNNTLNDGATAQLAYGTGVPPANGSAPAGTLIGQPQTMTTGVASQPVGITLIAVLTNLTVGTTYWFDINLKAVTGGTASISNVMAVVEEF